MTSTGRIGIGTNTPANNAEIKSGTAGVSGLRLTNLSGASYIGTDINGDIISANTSTTGSAITKLKLITISPVNVLNSENGIYSFRYSLNTVGGSWQIRYNSSGTRDISTFINEFWTPTNYSVQSSSATLSSGVWTNIPGSTNVGTANELNIFRIYDLVDGTTYRVEGNLVNVSGVIKEAMIIEQF